MICIQLLWNLFTKQLSVCLECYISAVNIRIQPKATHSSFKIAARLEDFYCDSKHKKLNNFYFGKTWRLVFMLHAISFTVSLFPSYNSHEKTLFLLHLKRSTSSIVFHYKPWGFTNHSRAFLCHFPLFSILIFGV